MQGPSDFNLPEKSVLGESGRPDVTQELMPLSPSGINTLAPELLVHILQVGQFTPKDLSVLSHINTLFYQISNDNSVWKTLIRKHLHYLQFKDPEGFDSNPKKTYIVEYNRWKSCYGKTIGMPMLLWALNDNINEATKFFNDLSKNHANPSHALGVRRWLYLLGVAFDNPCAKEALKQNTQSEHDKRMACTIAKAHGYISPMLAEYDVKQQHEELIRLSIQANDSIVLNYILNNEILNYSAISDCFSRAFSSNAEACVTILLEKYHSPFFMGRMPYMVLQGIQCSATYSDSNILKKLLEIARNGRYPIKELRKSCGIALGCASNRGSFEAIRSLLTMSEFVSRSSLRVALSNSFLHCDPRVPEIILEASCKLLGENEAKAIVRKYLPIVECHGSKDTLSFMQKTLGIETAKACSNKTLTGKKRKQQEKLVKPSSTNQTTHSYVPGFNAIIENVQNEAPSTSNAIEHPPKKESRLRLSGA